MTSRKRRSEEKPLDSLAEQRGLEDLQRNILDALTSRIAVIDVDGQIAWRNQAWRRFAEVIGSRAKEQDAVGENYLEFCERAHSESRPGAGPDLGRIAAAVRAVIAGQATEFSSEYFDDSADGPRTVRVTVTPLAPGRPGSAVVAHVDVTEDVRAGQSAALLGMALRVSRSGAWWADLDPLRLRWSAEVREFFELPPDYEPQFESELERLLPEHRAAWRAAFELCATHGRDFDLEFEARTATGRRFWIRSIAEAVRDGAGRIVRVQGALQDISQRKQAEPTLAASEQRFRQLAEALPMIVWSATPSGEVDYSNQRFFEYTGASPDAAPATRWQPSLHPDDLDECAREWKRSVEEGTPYEIEYRLRRALDGEYRWFRVQATPVRDSEGRVVKWFGTWVDVHETKQLEREARTLAKRLSTTFESIPDAFCTLDLSWRFQYVNSEAERLLRRSRSELVGAEVWSAFPDLRGSRLELELRRAASENVTVGLEHHAESMGMWFEVRAYPSDGGLTVYFRDVTGRVRFEQALRASEERFRLLSRATNDAIWDWDLVTGALWWNDGFERQFGFEREKLPPTIESWTERIHPDERESMLASVQQAIDTGAPSWSAEYRFLRADGQYVVVLDRGYVIRDDSGKPVRMIGGMNDLSDRRRAEETLRQQAALLDNAQDAILVRGLDQSITYWNRGAERVYGWSAEEVLGRSVLEVLYRDPEPCIAATEATLEHGEWTGELQHLTKRGQTLSVACRWTLLRDPAGRPRSILAIDTDVTRKKQLEAQFIRAQRMESIGTLAGGIAHDLNNVLAPIMISIELLQQSVESDDARELLQTIEASTRRGADLVRQVLSFARGVEGRHTPIALEHLLWEVQAIAQDTFPKNIAVSLDVERGLHVVSGDPTQLHQVFLNLVVNARDALPYGGSIRIHAENIAIDETYAAMSPQWRAGDFVIVTVADTGVGIAADDLNRIFEPFFTTKEVGKGTGLGLSTSLAIVRSHGGFIDVRSELGQGAAFKVFLPRSNEEGGAAPKAAASVARPRGAGELVLVVDDEASIRNVVQATLERFGYRVLLAANGAEAISIFAQRTDEIALVLTDLAMPIMDGVALIAALRTIRPRVRVVASSGLSSNRRLANSLGDTVRHFVPKPYTAECLLRTLREALDSPER
jgi:PAS domain S-box-containing protein